MSTPALPQPVPAVAPAKPFLDELFGVFWPEQSLPAGPRRVVAAVGAGLLAAVVLPFRAAGVGTFVVLLVAGLVVAGADRRLRTPYHLAAAMPLPAAGVDGVRARRRVDRDAVPAGVVRGGRRHADRGTQPARAAGVRHRRPARRAAGPALAGPLAHHLATVAVVGTAAADRC